MHASTRTLYFLAEHRRSVASYDIPQALLGASLSNHSSPGVPPVCDRLGRRHKTVVRRHIEAPTPQSRSNSAYGGARTRACVLVCAFAPYSLMFSCSSSSTLRTTLNSTWTHTVARTGRRVAPRARPGALLAPAGRAASTLASLPAKSRISTVFGALILLGVTSTAYGVCVPPLSFLPRRPALTPSAPQV